MSLQFFSVVLYHCEMGLLHVAGVMCPLIKTQVAKSGVSVSVAWCSRGDLWSLALLDYGAQLCLEWMIILVCCPREQRKSELFIPTRNSSVFPPHMV
uniref:Uncharacterized protein n=1 Tax=Anguilla anguilla TaxID=7936 RepID=A0A0E9QET0_ANGAN